MANTLNTQGLTTYVNANRDILASQLITMSPSTKWLNIQNGITTDTAIHGVLTDVEIQDGKACGFNAAGTQTITERKLTPAFLKVNNQYCAKDFYGTYKHYETKVALGKSPLPLEEALINDVIKAVANENERLIWSGKKASGDLVDGFTTIIAADSSIPAENKVKSTETSVLKRVQEMYAKISDKRVSAVMSAAMYRQLTNDIINANYFIYQEGETEEMVLTLPGTNFKVYGIDGIKDTDTNIYGVILDQMYVGMDNENDASMVDFFWSNDDRVYKLDIEWVLAVNYMFSENIYVYGV